jgi:hypothetical protein
MTPHNQDLALRRLFDHSAEELDSGPFMQQVLSELDRSHRAARRRNLLVALAASITALLLAPWMADAAETLTSALIEPGSSGFWQALAPLNSVAGIMLMTGLLLGRLLHLAR